MRFSTALCAAALLISACAEEASRNAPPRATGEEGRVVRLTDWAGAEDNARFSPDGERIAFQSWRDGSLNLYVLDLETGVEEQVTDDKGGNGRPAWSPDGRRLAFQSDRSGSTGIYVLSLDDGGIEPVVTSDSLAIYGPEWSPDGSRIAATGTPGAGGRLFVMSADGSDFHAVTHGNDEYWPHWSADSRSLVYYTGRYDSIMSVDVDTGSLTAISGTGFAGWRPIPSPADDRIAFVADKGGRWSLYLTDWAGRAPERLTTGGEDDYPAWSPDGARLVFSRIEANWELATVSVAGGAVQAMGERGQLPRYTSEGGVALLSDTPVPYSLEILGTRGEESRILDTDLDAIYGYSLSPSRNAAAFVAEGAPGSGRDVYIVPLSGGPAERVTELGDIEEVAWCGDGTLIVGTRQWGQEDTGQRGNQLVRVDRSGRRIEVLTEAPGWKRPTHCWGAAEKVAYDMQPGFRTQMVFLRNEAGAASRSVEIGPGNHGEWSPDGSRLAFVSLADGRSNVALWDSEGSVTLLTNDDWSISRPSWSVDGAALVFSRKKGDRDLWMLDLDPER